MGRLLKNTAEGYIKIEPGALPIGSSLREVPIFDIVIGLTTWLEAKHRAAPHIWKYGISYGNIIYSKCIGGTKTNKHGVWRNPLENFGVLSRMLYSYITDLTRSGRIGDRPVTYTYYYDNNKLETLDYTELDVTNANIECEVDII